MLTPLSTLHLSLETLRRVGGMLRKNQPCQRSPADAMVTHFAVMSSTMDTAVPMISQRQETGSDHTTANTARPCWVHVQDKGWGDHFLGMSGNDHFHGDWHVQCDPSLAALEKVPELRDLDTNPEEWDSEWVANMGQLAHENKPIFAKIPSKLPGV